MSDISLIRNEAIIIPARLREARISRAYSLTELGTLVGVSAQAISQYELGTNKPSITTLMKMASILKLPLEFFQKPYDEVANNTSSAIYFRSYKSTAQKLRKACRVKIGWVHEIYKFTQKFIEYPSYRMPDISHLLKDELDNEDIEKIAEYVRDELSLGRGPIDNLTNILQANGIVITKADLGTKKIDAFSVWYDGIPYIMLESDKGTACRWRFDLAHELGHLLLHNNIEEEDLKNKEILERIEQEAHYFAGAFLLPRDAFAKELMSTSINQFIYLKRKWRVSIQAMAKRAKNLGLISDNQERYVYINLNKMGGRAKEPLDDEIKYENPYLFKQAFKLLLDHNIFTPQTLLDKLAISKTEIDNLLFLPPELLTNECSTAKQPVLKVIKNN